MDIVFGNKKLCKQCNSLPNAQRNWGFVCGRKVLTRLDEMRDSESLKVLMTLPQARCHQLMGKRSKQWAVDLEHPRRLVFEIANDPIPRTTDGGIALEHVTAIRVIGVEDYHGKERSK